MTSVGSRALFLVSFAVFCLPLLAAGVTILPLWGAVGPGDVEDAQVAVILALVPTLVLAALQFAVVVPGTRSLQDVLVVLSALGAAAWLLLLIWRTALYDFKWEAVGLSLGSGLAFLLLASAV